MLKTKRIGTWVDESLIDHNALTNFLSNKHIDHTSISIIAGTLLTGGGTIATDRTLNVDEASIDHGSIAGLLDDDHTQYVLLAGRTGGQIIVGSDATLEDLTLKDNSVDNNSITVTQIIVAYTHVSNNGTDHSYIDQDLQTSATPTFAGLTSTESITGKTFYDTNSGGALAGNGIVIPQVETGEYAYGFQYWHAGTGDRYGVDFDLSVGGQGTVGMIFENTGTPIRNRYHTFTVFGNEGDFLHTDLTRSFSGDLSAGTVELTDGTDTITLQVGTNCQITVSDGTNAREYTSTGIRIGLTEKAFYYSGDSDWAMRFETYGFTLTNGTPADLFIFNVAGNFIQGLQANLATNATNGFLYISGGNGIPTGVPTAYTGKTPLYADQTNNKVYAYLGGNWVALN